MTACGYFRGHPIHWDEAEQAWRYDDGGERAGFGQKVKPCARCGLVFQGSNRGEADPCLGDLPGVDNACCGHGVREEAYVRFTNGVVLRGFEVEHMNQDREMCQECGLKHLVHERPADCIAHDCPYRDMMYGCEQ